MDAKDSPYIERMNNALASCMLTSNIYKSKKPVRSNGIEIKKVNKRERAQVDAATIAEFCGWRPFRIERHRP